MNNKIFFDKKINKEFKLLEFKNKREISILHICVYEKSDCYCIYGRNKNYQFIKNTQFFLKNLTDIKEILNVIDKIIKIINYSNHRKTYNFYLNSHYTNNFIHEQIKHWFNLKKLQGKIYNEVQLKIINDTNKNKIKIKQYLLELDFYTHQLALTEIMNLKQINFNISFKSLKENIKNYIEKFVQKRDFIPNGIHEISLEYFDLKKLKFEKINQNFDLTKIYYTKH